jgi:outer membrane immunogenic protein
MIRNLRAAALMAAAVAAVPAAAGDMSAIYAPASPAARGDFSWAGAYAGLNLGYQWAVSQGGVRPSGAAGGLQGGYNWQTGQFVHGLESDLQLSTADDTFAGYKFANPWFGTLRGRGGLAVNNVLLYLTAGLSYGGGKVEFAGLGETQSHVGWTAGSGIELGVTPAWSAKAEYLHIGLSDRTYAPTAAGTGLQSNIVRFGVNYRF